MTRKVFVHIGAPKTGTTYLQDRLFLNRAELEGHGVSYPVGLHADMFGAAVDLIERPWGGQKAESEGYWDGLMKRVHRNGADTVVVSHEILAGARPEQIERAMGDLAGFEVHVVYTARDLARQIPAEWQEQVKHRGQMPFRRFLRQVRSSRQTNPDRWFWRVQGLPDVLTRWGRHLPSEHVHLITVPQSGAPKDLLWHRFCEVVGMDPCWAPAESTRHNPSLGIAEVTMVRRLNDRINGLGGLEGRDYRQLVREVIAHRTLAYREDTDRVTVPPRSYDWISEVAEHWIEWVQGSGIDLTGDLDELRPRFPEPGPDGTVAWVNPDKPRARDVADAGLDAIAAVLFETAKRPNPQDTVRAQVGKAVRRFRGGV